MTDSTGTSREEWDGLTADKKFYIFQLMEERDNELNKLLHAIPECPAHGHECIPHAHEWITEQVTGVKAADKPNLLEFERLIIETLDDALSQAGLK